MAEIKKRWYVLRVIGGKEKKVKATMTYPGKKFRSLLIFLPLRTWKIFSVGIKT